MPVRFQPTLCSQFLFVLVLLNGLTVLFGQTRYGTSVSVIRGNPQVPVLVPDAAATFDQQQLILKSKQTPVHSDATVDGTCFLAPLAGIRTKTVKLGALEAQVKGSPEYEKACSALADKKFDAAERHLRKATQEYAEYPAVWVLLGQVLEKKQEMGEARASCAHAAVSSSTYVPAYLCLADISARTKDWRDSLKQSEKALAIDPASTGISYMFQAVANFYLGHLQEAEKGALRAVQFGPEVDGRQAHYLLAEIYEAKGNVAGETEQLRQFLKISGDPKENEAVKQYLAKIEGRSGGAARVENVSK
jgi:tetratricopeptide (TPR) repeat protein